MADDKKAKWKKKTGVKNFLTSPYSLDCGSEEMLEVERKPLIQIKQPKLDKGDNKRILDGIRSVFPTDGIKREKKEMSSDKEQFVSWEMTKECLVIGVNSVTKSLEKDKLTLVLVCRSTKPAILTNHLMLLSATRSTPCCAVFGLNEVMAPLFGMKTVAACGFKKDITASILKDLVEYIACKIPPLSDQYLKIWNTTGRGISGVGFENDQKEEHEHISATKGRKRSFADIYYVNTQIKCLQPRETPKIKKKKKSLKATQ